jgi:hypothetical protein
MHIVLASTHAVITCMRATSGMNASSYLNNFDFALASSIGLANARMMQISQVLPSPTSKAVHAIGTTGHPDDAYPDLLYV